MKTKDGSRTSLMNNLGAFTVTAWLLLPGIAGVALLGGVAYAMFAGYLALGVICGVFLCVPLGSTVVWGSLRWVDILRSERRKGEKVSREVWYRQEDSQRAI
jgi:hypothetical protein